MTKAEKRRINRSLAARGLRKAGWSYRKIAAELGADERTIRRDLRHFSAAMPQESAEMPHQNAAAYSAPAAENVIPLRRAAQ